MSTTYSGPCESGPYEGQLLVHHNKDCVFHEYAPSDGAQPSRVLGCYTFDTSELIWKWSRAQ